MFSTFSAIRTIFGRPEPTRPETGSPAVGDVFYRQPENGPVEYAQIIGVYTEAAEIQHVRFRLVYRYKDKTAELGERTLAASHFHKRFDRQIETKHAAE